MRLYSADEKKSVDVGTGSIWYSIYSTAMVALSDDAKREIPQVISFLKNGNCSCEDVKSTKKQMQILRNAFTEIPPNRAVYDLHKPNVTPPWGKSIAPTVTSCANLYTTADGEDLFTQVIDLLSYAEEAKVDVLAG